MRIKKLKVYLDTSIINFLFADDAPEKQEITIDFFENRLDQYAVAISDIVLFEISRTQDPTKRNILAGAVKKYSLPLIELDDFQQQAIDDLADRYIEAGIIPPAKRDDAVHVAICTFFEFDILLSWNFRHLANFNKQTRINALNEQMGYMKRLNLLTPLEVMDENE